jgi:RHS repeat-associated protein
MRRLKLALASLATVAIANAQSEDRVISPTKGFQPGHSYALSDIESIDKATGTLSLHIPITQLPPGPGGFTAGLTLSYNDRYWETEPHYDSSSGNTFYGLRQSAYGGWRLKMAPELDFEYLVQNTVDDMCVYSNTIFQMWIVNPDGSRNQLYLSQANSDILTCPVGTYDLNGINTVGGSTWYTADGSYRRIVIDPATGTTGFWPMTASWTVYEQDGSSIRIDVGANAAYFSDRNGNRITVTYSAAGTTSTELMADAYGRTIRLLHDHGNLKDVVTQIGHDGDSNNPLTWTVQYANFPAWPFPPEKYLMVNGPGNQYIAAVPTGLPLASSLTLPNNLSYTFIHGALLKELSQVTLPTGAIANYSYHNDGACCGTIWYWDALLNPVKSKTLTHDGLTDSWTYDFGVVNGVTGGSQITGPDGGKTSYQCVEVSFNPSVSLDDPGLLLKTTNPDGSIVQREWADNKPYEMPVRGIGMNSWVQRELTTTASSSGQPVATSIQVFTIDKNGNRTSREERGWVAYSGTTPASSSATLLRKTINTYAVAALDSTATGVDTNAYSYPSPPSTPRNLVAGSETQNGSGTIVSRSEFNYTEASPSRTVGNLVDEYRWDSTQASSIASGATLTDSGPNSNAVRKHYTYSANGNLATETDERGHTVTYTYGSVSCPSGTFSDLYRTSIQRGGLGSVLQNWTYGYNCYSGMRTSINDPNSLATTIRFDRYSRPTKIVEGNLRTTQHYYNDSSRWIVSLDDASSAGDQASVNVYRYDQLGRIRLTQKLETTTDYATAGGDETLGIQVKTAYQYNTGSTDVLVSNPSRPSDNTETTRGWTVTRKDIVGRPCAQETFDGSALPTLASACGASSGATARTSYSYNATVNWTKARVTDPAGATRDLYSDALARLIAVVEDPGSSKYATYYGYNARDNLETVQQAGTCNQTDPIASPCPGGVSRTFAYTSLNRLSSATNPESGTIQYGYDKTGNLLTKTSPAPNQTGSATVTTCFGNWTGTACDGTKGYDDLNRLLLKNYSDGATPPVQYTYDAFPQNANLPFPPGYDVGRLISVWTSGKGAEYSHDQLGRVAYLFDCVEPTSCNNSLVGYYQYAPTGNITKATYRMWYWNGTSYSATTTPLTFNQSFDAAARPTLLTSDLIDSQHPATLLTVDPNFGYYPNGTIRKVTLGNGLTETAAYNTRLQPCRMNVNYTGGYYSQCTDAASGNVLDFTYGYNAGANNGNITFWSAAGNQTFSRTYTYDSLNRIATMADSASSQSCQGLSWTIDPWGNRTDQTVTAGACNTFHQAVDTTSNRLLGAPFQYDAAGNMIHDASHSYTYDAENRLIQVDGGSTATYAYDPDGRRAAKTISGTTTNYAYDTGSNVLFETQGSSWTTAYIYFAGALHAQYKNNTTYFVHRDHLGSTRLVTGVGTQIANGGFEQGLTGWGIGGSTAQLITDPTRAHSGSNYVQLSTPANGGVDIQTGLVAVNPGDQVAFGGWAYLESGSGGALGWWLAVYDSNYNPVTYVGSSPGPSSGWAYESGNYTVPSNGAYVLLYAQIYQPSASTVLRVDDGFLAIGRTATTVDNLDYLPFGEQIAGGTSTTHKFTGKERDAETGLDYFGARYFSSTQGRFTSPDPPVLDQHIYDPQSWNLYTYARNNPLRFVDPTGNAIKLLGDEDQRKKELALLQGEVGKKASGSLYINEVKDGDKTRYFVGIKGDVGDFMKLSNASHDLANLVQDKNVVEFGLTSQNLARWGGAVTFEKGEAAKYGMPANENVRVLVNPAQMDIANERLTTPNLLGASRWPGQDASPPWHIYDYDTGIATFHEFGHAWGFIHGRVGEQTNREALDWENRVREQLYGPLGPRNAPRIKH